MYRSGYQIGPYTLVKQLGRGAYGIVWLAERKGKIATTKVAIKLILEEEPNLAALSQEAELWAQLSGHPNILPIIEAEVYDDQAVIVSEYAPDGSLHEWLKKYRKDNPNTTPPAELVLKLILGVLEGLGHLHSKNIIHRDLKPQNILLQGEIPRLADFGLARILKTSAQSTGISGTPAYMAPEAFSGGRSEQTDLWSVGVILYQLLKGSHPFPQDDPTVLMYSIVNKEPEPLPDTIPNSLQQIVFKNLQKDPTKRFQSVREMKAALEAYKETINKPNLIVANSKLGPYKLTRKLGKGNFGEVWLASFYNQSGTEQKVAVKIILELEQDLAAIRKEAQIWIEIGKHPNIVSIIDSNIYDDIPLIVSEYVPDGTLQEWLDRYLQENSNNPPRIKKVVDMIDGILAGLEHLHSKKIVHRDLKPANILLEGETPRLVDFGISRVVKTNQSTQRFVGTPVYIAPETINGDTRTISADIWAVGVIFYQLLTTKLPFFNKELVLLYIAICEKDFPTLPPEIPECIVEIITKALKKEPSERYNSAKEMRLVIKKAIEKISEEIKSPLIDNAEIVKHSIQEPLVNNIQQLPIVSNNSAAENILGVSQEALLDDLQTVKLKVGEELSTLANTEKIKQTEISTGTSQIVEPFTLKDTIKLIGSPTQKLLTSDNKQPFLTAIEPKEQNNLQVSQQEPINKLKMEKSRNGEEPKTLVKTESVIQQTQTNSKLETKSFSKAYLLIPVALTLLVFIWLYKVAPNSTPTPETSPLPSPFPDITSVVKGASKKDVLLETKEIVNAITISHDGKLVAAVGDNSYLLTYKVDNDEKIQSNLNYGKLRSVALSPNGELLAISGDDHTIRLLDARSNQVVKELSGHKDGIFQVIFSKDGKTLYSAGYEKMIYIWDIGSSTVLHKMLVPPNEYVMSVSQEGEVALYNKKTGTVSILLVKDGSSKNNILGNYTFSSSAFSSNGELFAIGGSEGKVTIYSVKSNLVLNEIKEADKHVTSVDFNFNGRLLAAGYTDGSIKIWQVDTGVPVKKWNDSKKSVSGVVFSKDNKLLAFASDDNKLVIKKLEE